MTYARVYAERQYKSAVETIKTCTNDKVELGKVAFTHKGRIVYITEGVFCDYRWFFIKE